MPTPSKQAQTEEAKHAEKKSARRPEKQKRPAEEYDGKNFSRGRTRNFPIGGRNIGAW